MLNGYSVNGAYLPTWVVRAAVVAAAAAAVITVAPQRILLASAYGDASVVITLTETQVVAARATGNAGSTTSSVSPRIIYSGAVDADAAATGYALVVRLIQAEAGGDAAATGIAVPNAKLGEALASAASTVIVCDAHRIRPGASIQFVGATADPLSALVTRSPAGAIVTPALATGRGEASVKLDGQSYFRHDGYVLNAVARCTPTIDQEKTAIIASFGLLDYGNSNGAGTAFVRHTGLVSSTGVSVGVSASASRTARSTVLAPAVATATVDGTLVYQGTVTGSAAATSVMLHPAQRFAAASTSSAFLNAVQAAGVRQARGTVLGQSTAYQTEIFFGLQFPSSGGGNAVATGSVVGVTVGASASSSAVATASAETATQHYADASGVVLALAGTATTGNQSFGTATNVAQAGAIVTERLNPGARGIAAATGIADAANFFLVDVEALAEAIGAADYAQQQYGHASGTARATGSAVGGLILRASVSGVIARATAVSVSARTISDEPAPDERQMILSEEGRGMLVPAEDRTMVVSA